MFFLQRSRQILGGWIPPIFRVGGIDKKWNDPLKEKQEMGNGGLKFRSHNLEMERYRK